MTACGRVEAGINNKFIDSVRDKITPGTSALFLLTSDAVTDRVTEEMKQHDFELLATNLSAEDEAKLRGLRARGGLTSPTERQKNRPKTHGWWSINCIAYPAQRPATLIREFTYSVFCFGHRSCKSRSASNRRATSPSPLFVGETGIFSGVGRGREPGRRGLPGRVHSGSSWWRRIARLATDPASGASGNGRVSGGTHQAPRRTGGQETRPHRCPAGLRQVRAARGVGRR